MVSKHPGQPAPICRAIGRMTVGAMPGNARTIVMPIAPTLKLIACDVLGRLPKPVIAGGYHETSTETRTMTSAKRNNQLQLGDFLILFAVGVTILGGLYTLIA